MTSGIYKRTPEMKTGKYKRTPEHCANLSKVLKNSEAAKVANDAQRGVPRPPKTCAKISKSLTGRKLSPEHIAALKNSDARKAANEAKKGVPRSPETCAKMSKSLTGRKLSPEHCAVLSTVHEGVPLSPEHIDATIKGMEEAGVHDKQRGGNDILKHHHIYDYDDLSKYTIEMTRSQHTSLHRNMQLLGVKVPHINTGHENGEELKLMGYIKKIEEEFML